MVGPVNQSLAAARMLKDLSWVSQYLPEQKERTQSDYLTNLLGQAQCLFHEPNNSVVAEDGF